MKAKFIHFKEISSTNTYAIQNIDNLEDKTVIWADKQTCGKGRLGKIWQSDNISNLYFSIILKPTKKINPDLPLANLTQYMSVILCRILDTYEINSQIKWPNDILVSDKKISGILAETSAKGNQFKGIVIGVGLNLKLSKEELAQINQPATALDFETKNDIEKKALLTKITEAFFDDYDNFLTRGFDLIKEDYKKKCFFLGSKIKINEFDKSYEALAKDINEDGTLKIELNGNTKNIHMGEIFCI